MVRSIIAVIVGYISMFLLNFLGFVGLYTAIGPTQAFKPRSFLASNRWIAFAFAIVFITGIIAGIICAAIARGGRAPAALALLVLVIGLLMGIPAVMKGKANAELVRASDVPAMEAAEKAYWPVWAPFALPFASALGVLVGPRVRKRN